MVPIASRPFDMSCILSFANVLRDAERMPIDAAILTKEETLIPVVNDIKESCRELRMSLKPCCLFLIVFGLKILLKLFSILRTKLDSFVARTNIPPPVSPAKISRKETLSVIHPKTFVTAFHILEATLQMLSPIEENILPKPPILSNAVFIVFEIPLTISDNTPVMPSVLKLLFKDVKKSPIRADMSRRKLPRLPIPSDPTSCPMGLRIAVIIFLPISKIEKKPLNVLFILSMVSSLIDICSVNFLNLSVKEYTWSPVIDGKISLNASPMGLITFDKFLNMLAKPSIIFSLPDTLAIDLANLSRSISPC